MYKDLLMRLDQTANKTPIQPVAVFLTVAIYSGSTVYQAYGKYLIVMNSCDPEAPPDCFSPSADEKAELRA